MKMKRKVFTGEIKGVDEDKRTLTAYISTKGKDRMDEVLDPSGADLKPFRKNPVVMFGHDYWSTPIAKALWVKQDNKGLVSKMEFAETEFAEEVFKLYQGGFMNAFSVGFIPKKWEDGDGKKQPTRKYTDWELLEYSAVSVPANPDALVLAVQKGFLSEKTKIEIEEGNAKTKDDDTTDEEFNCECLECGHTIKTKEHCKDTPCPECGGKMRREERPGPGEKDADNKDKVTDEDMEVSALIATNQDLVDEIDKLQKENADLRKQIYTLYVKYQQKGTVSEIADDELAKVVSETVIGAVRHATGKVG